MVTERGCSDHGICDSAEGCLLHIPNPGQQLRCQRHKRLILQCEKHLGEGNFHGQDSAHQCRRNQQRQHFVDSLQIYYYVATDIGPTTVETLEIPVTIAVDTTTATFPLPASTFTFTVSLAPIQGPYQTSGSNINTPIGLLAPRFAASEVGPANLVTIQGSSTTLLVPYGYASKTAGDFNTAMAVSNTSEDPGIGVLGFTGAVANAGPVTFYLFSQDNTLPMFTYKTVAGSPGSGLDASGNVISGGTYSVFLSQIFPLATPPTGSTAVLGNNFTGYVLIYTGFTHAHGIFVISNFTTLTAQSSLMLVLSDRSITPEKAGF